MQTTTLIWFRRNLRLTDNAALRAAVARGLPVAGVFALHRPSETAEPRSVWFRHQAAAELARRLAAKGVPLFTVQGDAAAEIPALAHRLNAQSVWADEGYMPSEILQDNHIWRLLDEKGIAFERVNDRAVFAKADLMNEYSRPFRDFAPYKQAWLAAWRQRFDGMGEALYRVPNHPQRPSENMELPVQTAFADLPLFPESEDWTGDIGLPPQGGETAALRQWQKFQTQLDVYPLLKDFPAKKATAHLSAYLAAGCLSPRVLAQEAVRTGATDWLENLIRRDFYLQYAFHGLDAEALPAAGHPSRNEDFFQRWTQGITGFPLMDAAMRCLKSSGWLAPVLRQAAAEFWCGTLRQPWQHGAAWFAAQQIDHDDALNRGNWQAAAARVHTPRPVVLSQQLDPDGGFIRRHVPELAHLPKNLIHTPWLAGADIDRHGYPLPMIEAV